MSFLLLDMKTAVYCLAEFCIMHGIKQYSNGSKLYRCAITDTSVSNAISKCRIVNFQCNAINVSEAHGYWFITLAKADDPSSINDVKSK